MRLVISIMIILTALAVVAPVFAAGDKPIDQTGEFLNTTAGAGQYNTSEYGRAPLISTIAAVVQGILSLLGIIFFLFVIYAGFLWVTANGDEDRITKAKGILKNNIIGIVVVLAAGVIVGYAVGLIIQLGQ